MKDEHTAEVIDHGEVLSSSKEADPLQVWLARQFDRKEDGQPPVLIKLSHLDAAGHGAPMDQFDLDEPSMESSCTYTGQLRYLARQDAELRGHMERYSITVWWGNGESCYQAISVEGAQVREQEMLGHTEGPTSSGLQKQLMRHTEMLVRLVTGSAVQREKEHVATTDRLLNRIDTLEDQRNSTLELQEELLTKRAERDLMEIKALNGEARKDRALTQLEGLLPIAKAKFMEHVTGQKMLTGTDPGVALTKDFLGSLDLAAFERILKTLEPNQQAALFELYRAAQGLPPREPETEEPAADKTETKGDGAQGDDDKKH